jgi:hypothetical protein
MGDGAAFFSRNGVRLVIRSLLSLTQTEQQLTTSVSTKCFSHETHFTPRCAFSNNVSYI